MTVFLAFGRERIGHPVAVVWWLVPPLTIAEFLYLTPYNMPRALTALR